MILLMIMFFTYMMIVNNRLLMNLILVEMFGIIFMLNFMFINIFSDNLFIIVFSFFILESVVGLIMLIMLINATGIDYMKMSLFNY